MEVARFRATLSEIEISLFPLPVPSPSGFDSSGNEWREWMVLSLLNFPTAKDCIIMVN